MTSHEAATNIVIALINNSRIVTADDAATAYQLIIKAIDNIEY